MTKVHQTISASSGTRHIPIIPHTALSLPAQKGLYDRMFLKPTDLDTLAREIRALLAAAV